ncbi:MAG: hypothetical protein R3F11_23030 [Verrucomicrobiales bacterium]
MLTSGEDELRLRREPYQVSGRQRGDLDAGKTGMTGTPEREEEFAYDPSGNWSNYTAKVDGATALDQPRAHNRLNETTRISGSGALVASDSRSDDARPARCLRRLVEGARPDGRLGRAGRRQSGGRKRRRLLQYDACSGGRSSRCPPPATGTSTTTTRGDR